MSYYNTINLKGTSLEEANLKAKSQCDVIKIIFSEFKDVVYTPFNVHEIYESITKKSTPITSIRRAISDLTDEGFLKKTDRMILGNYGAKNYLWKLNK